MASEPGMDNDHSGIFGEGQQIRRPYGDAVQDMTSTVGSASVVSGGASFGPSTSDSWTMGTDSLLPDSPSPFEAASRSTRRAPSADSSDDVDSRSVNALFKLNEQLSSVQDSYASTIASYGEHAPRREEKSRHGILSRRSVLVRKKDAKAREAAEFERSLALNYFKAQIEGWMEAVASISREIDSHLSHLPSSIDGSTVPPGGDRSRYEDILGPQFRDLKSQAGKLTEAMRSGRSIDGRGPSHSDGSRV